QLSRPRVGQEDMPHLVSTLRHRDPDVFCCVFDVVAKAKLNSTRVLVKNSKVHAVTHPGCTQRIRLTEKCSYLGHKRAAHLSGIDLMLAMTMGRGINSDVVVFD